METCEFYVPKSTDVLVGKGGYGSVFKTPSKQCVVKISHNRLPCSKLHHEFDMTKLMSLALDASLTSTEKKYIGIMRPSRFGECDHKCCFSMQYLRPLSPRDAHVTQAYLALPSHSKVLVNKNEVRGVYRGTAELARIVRAYGLTTAHLAYYVGVAMAAMHYGAKLTGVDTEVVIAFTGKQTVRPKIFIIDHDRNSHLDVSRRTATVSMLSSLLGSGEPYYPLFGVLGKAFGAGYVKKARDLGFEDIAKEVLEVSALESLASPPLPL